MPPSVRVAGLKFPAPAREKTDRLVKVSDRVQNVHGVQLRAVGSGEADIHRHQGGILLPQPGHQALFRLVHAGRMGIDVEPVNLLGARLPAYHRAKPALGKAVPQVMLDLGDLGAVAQNLEIDDLIRLIALSVQIVAVGKMQVLLRCTV